MDPQSNPPTANPNGTDVPPATNDNDAAAAFARAKISAIFQEPTARLVPGGEEAAPAAPTTVEPQPPPTAPMAVGPTSPLPPAPTYPTAAPPTHAQTAPQFTTPSPEQFYQTATTPQNELQPGTPQVAPDYQPPVANPTPSATFQTLNLPGQTVNPTVPQAPSAGLANPPITQPGVITPPVVAVGSSMPPTRSEQIKQFATSGAEKLRHARRKGHILRPLIKSTLVTAVVFLVYNAPIVLGQVHYYITPANSEPTPIILNETTAGVVGPEPKIIISKLNIDVPAVYDETSFDEGLIQAALERGIVHYGTTAVPGELGNAVFLGHSSNSPWAPGKFKTAFSLLRRLEVSDTFVVHFQSQRYIYEVYDKRIVNPSDFSVIDQNVSEPVVTLITCDPPGANWNRLAIQARQISPDPTKAHASATAGTALPDAGALPGSPPSLFDRIRDWFF